MGELGPPEEERVGCEVVDQADGVTVLRLSGELDLSTIEALEPVVAEALAAAPRRLVVDLAAVQFADSSAIALWIAWRRMVPEIELRNPSPLVRRVIDAMGLNDVLNVT